MAEKILVTGTSSGFGTLITNALLEAGHRVAASMRDTDGRNRQAAETLAAAGASIVEIDVTDNASVERGTAAAIDALGGLTVLVNNAGFGVIGLQESFTDEDFRRLFEVNVFGVQRMNRAVLPLFREQGNGLLLHISSLLGRITIPFYGPYNASKWALEALAENYRSELSAFGVESCVIEPGGYATDFIGSLVRPSDDSRNAGYGEMAGAPDAALKGFHEMLKQSPHQDPSDVAKAVVDLVATPKGERLFRTVVDNVGMGAGIGPYNEAHAELTLAIYTNMGSAHMLKVRG